jgi:hypothetical protein
MREKKGLHKDWPENATNKNWKYVLLPLDKFVVSV